MVRECAETELRRGNATGVGGAGGVEELAVVRESECSENGCDDCEDEESNDFGPGVVGPRGITPISSFLGVEHLVGYGSPEPVINNFLIRRERRALIDEIVLPRKMCNDTGQTCGDYDDGGERR